MSSSQGYAQAVLNLPEPGALVKTSEAYVPVIIKGLTIDSKNPFMFDFIVDPGNSGLKAGADDAAIKEESQKLVKYFLASLTLPEKDQWVNLSPYEKDRMMPSDLEKTELGRDMLSQDYLLKQVTASLIYPENDLGEQFWQKVYAQAKDKFGTADIPMDTFNKVWVAADKADVYVHENTAFVVGSHLKVMLESDYLAASEQKMGSAEGSDEPGLAKQVVREVVLPAIEAEVNTGKNFAQLRQIFHSMILATWYKKNLKEALLTQVYANQAKMDGIERAQNGIDPQMIYARYLEAYRKGVFNLIKEEVNEAGETVPHKYFSGGLAPTLGIADGTMKLLDATAAEVRDFNMDNAMRVSVRMSVPDAAMFTKDKKTAADRTRSMEPFYRGIGLNLTPDEIITRVAAEIKDQNIGVDQLSLAVNRNGLVVLGPVSERAPQYFRVILPDDSRMDLITSLQEVQKKYADVKIERKDLDGKSAYAITIPPSQLSARREVLRLLFKDIVKERSITVFDSVFYEPAGLALTDSMARQIFVAEAERRLLSGFEEAAAAAKVKYKELYEFFQNVAEGKPAKLVLTKELVQKWNLKEGLVKDLKDLARKALAGMRETQNPLAPYDLTKQINILLTLLVCNELAEMSLGLVAPGKTPQAVIGGEVRFNTPTINDMLRRRLAQLGFTVHSPKKGIYLPIGASSFITTIEDIIMALYDTSSHAPRQIYASKINGPRAIKLSEFETAGLTELGDDPARYEQATSEGAQLLIDQMVALAAGVESKIDRVLNTGEPLELELASADDPRIHFDLDNPEAGEANNNVSEKYADYLRASYINEAAQEEIRGALTSGLMYGFSQGNGASYGFNQRVLGRLIGEEATNRILWADTHPDSFYNGTGMWRYNPKKPKDRTVIQFLTEHREELFSFFGRREPGFSLETKVGPKGGKQIYMEVFPPSAEKAILRPNEIPFIVLPNHNLLAFYEPTLSDGSEDVSLLEVVMNSSLPSYLMDKPVGFIEATTDPDGDRFVVMQVEKNDKKTRERLASLNIAFLELTNEKLLAVYVPNQNFFDIQGSLIDTLKARGEFRQDRDDFDEYNDVTFFGISTTVSTSLWRELWRARRVPTVLVPVGFKEIARIEQLVEEQVNLNRLRERLGLKKRRVIVHDVFGQAIDLGYNPRLLFAGEESGGLVVGKKDLIVSEDGTRSFLAWREKSAVEANALFLKMISEMFNRARQAVGQDVPVEEAYQNRRFLNGMSLSLQLQRKIEAQGSKNIAELRTDYSLIDPIRASQMGEQEVRRYKERANAQRNANDAFWVSLAFAYEDGQITLEEAREVIEDALTNDQNVISTLTNITNKDEVEVKRALGSWLRDELTDILYQGDGVYLSFRSGGYTINRPSGTDPKLKGYPSTNDPFISAILSNAVVRVDPLEKAPEQWQSLFAAKGLLDYLNGDKVLARKQSQYERGLQVDQRVSWQPVVQALLNAETRFRLIIDKPGVVSPEMQVSSDVMVRLGPKSQTEAFKYVPRTGSIYVSWDTDAKMKALSKDPEALTSEFQNGLNFMTVNDKYGEQVFSKGAEADIDAAMKNPGGIDMNADNMFMTEQGQKVDMQFDPAMVEQFKAGDFTGLTPVILQITPIANVRMLLGLAPDSFGSGPSDAGRVIEAVRRDPEA